jgi:trehalose 6-phosphate phosphatase
MGLHPKDFLPPHAIGRDWALFLDFDGTLVDIAPTPDAVRAPRDLLDALLCAREATGGALAIISGRPLSEIDRLLDPLRLPAAGVHGAEFRTDPSGAAKPAPVEPLPIDWVREIADAASRCPGVIVENKIFTVAVHFRLAPAHAETMRTVLAAVVARGSEDYEIMDAHCAYELRPRSVNKAHALRRFMKRPPFAGRRPVMVGDDVTDFDGIRAARALGGEGWRVPVSFPAGPADVRRWLLAACAGAPA